MPPSVKSTAKPTKSESEKGSRRRLFFLLTTAAIASSLGIALGSTLRFQVVPVSQASLFKPQQDFPPLEAWPPEVPSAKQDKFDANWDNEAPTPQLVYNDPYNEQPYLEEDAYDEGHEDTYDEEPYISEESFIQEDITNPNPAAFLNEDGSISNETFEEERLLPEAENSTEELSNDFDVIESPQVDDSMSVTDTSQRFNKQPLSDSQFSDSQFTDGPVITSPDISIPSSDLSSD
ncbi:MAG: hypothetical protein KTR27_22020 [Leptolyngbyaceae cyanobacterium MAG.088]|nr:hypothetical protein [Leptolyngbyaceae cyanobacterium MAG.088]